MHQPKIDPYMCSGAALSEVLLEGNGLQTDAVKK